MKFIDSNILAYAFYDNDHTDAAKNQFRKAE